MVRLTPEGVRDQRSLLFPLFLVILLLTGLGLTALYSASSYRAGQLAGDSFHYVKRQMLFVLLGVSGGIFITLIPDRVLRIIIPLALGISLVLMILTLTTPLGEVRLGARRWLRIGPLSMQPSEVVKVSVILFLANYLGKHDRDMQRLSVTLIPVGVSLLFAALILLQRDFSTAVLFITVCFAMIAVSSTRLIYLVYVMLITVIPGALLLLSEEYRFRRVLGFLFSEADPSGINYQVNMSLRAVAAGGIWGSGFGLGTVKYRIPEVSSDFIFAAYAEETGLIGVGVVTLLFIALGVIGFRSASAHRRGDPRLFQLSFGCTCMVLWQALINMAVVIGALPPTGLPLPFFSLGGTNLTMVMVMCGCIARSVTIPAIRESSYGELDSAEYVLYK